MSRAASPEIMERFKVGFEQWNCGEIDLMQEDYAEDAEFDFSAVFYGHGTPPRSREHSPAMGRDVEGMGGHQAGSARSLRPRRRALRRGRALVEKGKRSGVGVDQRLALLYTVREADQKVVRNQLFPSVQVAMEAAASKSAAPSV